MKRFNTAIMLILFAIVIPIIAHSQSATDAYKSLKKLESKIEIGINYKDYSTALGDINYEVKEFLESREAKKKPKLAESLERVMTHHKNAMTVWKDSSLTDIFDMPAGIIKIVDNDGIVHFKRGEVDKNSFESYILKSYPEIEKAYNIGKKSGKEIRVGEVLNIIWNAASFDLKNVKTLLVK
jgi:hypothetical protein